MAKKKVVKNKNAKKISQGKRRKKPISKNSPNKNKKRGRIIVAVSGGFDPIHVGHIRHFEEAKRLGDELVVILNNDNWLKAKKGYVFMPEKERKEVLLSLKAIDRVIVSEHKPGDADKSVCRELKMVKPHVYAKGGDRTRDNILEVAVCEEINCKIVFGVGWGGKVQSSSWLLEKFRSGS